MPEAPQPPPLNPYSAPEVIDAPPGPDWSRLVAGGFFRDGRFLVIRDGAELPMACVKSGESAPAGSWRKRRLMSWSPPWVFIGLLGGLLPLLILMVVASKKAHLVYSLGPAAARRRANLQLVGLLLLGASLASIAGVITETIDGDLVLPLILGSIAGIIASLVFFIVSNPLRAIGHRKGWFKIKGASPGFLDTLETGDWRQL